ncbi:hypothetical protein [Sinobaca sp. H24]|uniref:hypothetical protein n=1 Tax=Sinobaca sp. H24 TaxID=2923376 RepID=UPI00207AA7A2|nr:hypothetical protein [Sinobaca sp. H24]
MIGSGAVVTKNVPNYAVMLGVPAKHRGWACECGEILNENLVCSNCFNEFKLISNDSLEIIERNGRR